MDTATAATFDDHRMAEDYTSRAVVNADIALSMLDVADRTYSSDKNSRFSVDWIPKHEGKDRVLHLHADAECMPNTIRNDETLKT